MTSTGPVRPGMSGIDALWTGRGNWSEGTIMAVHMAVFAAIYTVYGQNICPILHGLPVQHVAVPAIVALFAQFALRSWIKTSLATARVDKRIRWGFWSDFALFALGGVILAASNRYFYSLPLENLLKTSTAFLALGFYIALDMSLIRERQEMARMTHRGTSYPQTIRAMPFTRKLVLFSVVNLAVLAGMATLVVYKDVLYAAKKGLAGGLTQTVIMIEVIFVVAVLSAYVVRVIQQFSRNLKVLIEAECKALTRVADGELDTSVPVLSNDEFGIIASSTNAMILRLRDTISDLERTQDVSIKTLVTLAAKRDDETGAHLTRTQMFVEKLAEAMHARGMHKDYLTHERITLLRKSAPLHDIGKVGIPDSILQKPGKLTEQEFAVMKTHTTIGAQALAEAETDMGESCFLSLAREMTESHHEKWNGTGYPHGLSGQDIPLSGRIMAVADVYDALRSERVYKAAFSHGQACEIIVKDSGTHFDPDVVQAFTDVADAFEAIAAAHTETTDSGLQQAA